MMWISLLLLFSLFIFFSIDRKRGKRIAMINENRLIDYKTSRRKLRALKSDLVDNISENNKSISRDAKDLKQMVSELSQEDRESFLKILDLSVYLEKTVEEAFGINFQNKRISNGIVYEYLIQNKRETLELNDTEVPLFVKNVEFRISSLASNIEEYCQQLKNRISRLGLSANVGPNLLRRLEQIQDVVLKMKDSGIKMSKLEVKRVSSKLLH